MPKTADQELAEVHKFGKHALDTNCQNQFADIVGDNWEGFLVRRKKKEEKGGHSRESGNNSIRGQAASRLCSIMSYMIIIDSNRSFVSPGH